MPWFNRANAKSRLGDDSAALADLDAAIRLSPGDVAALHNRGRIRARRGDHTGAVADNLEALRLRPDDARTCNNLAWLWATTPRDELRDPVKAVEHARKACELTNWQEPGYLDTLAVAYAAAGRFEEAIHWQRPRWNCAARRRRRTTKRACVCTRRARRIETKELGLKCRAKSSIFLIARRPRCARILS